MNRIPYHPVALAILFGYATGVLSAQTPYDAGYLDEAAQIKEQVHLFTDRNMYAVNEIIHFRAQLSVSGPIEEDQWSSVLYVELVAPGGKPMAQGKYLFSGGVVEGTLDVPAESLSGMYYLRSYTRWMRNRGPHSFSYTPLKIINPFRSEVSVPTDETGPGVTFETQSYQEGVLDCTTGSEIYKGGAEALLHLKGPANGLYGQLKACVTVAPAGAVDLSGSLYVKQSDPEKDVPFSVRFLPDLGSGLTISGTVVGPGQKAAPYTTLHFSLLGETPDFFAAISDENGRFILTITSGTDEKMEFFVTPEQEEGAGLEVRIDQEYDSRALDIPGGDFTLSGEEKEVARNIALRMQLSKAFQSREAIEEPTKQELSEGNRIPFYGTRVKRLLIDDYVRLPNLEEVFINLVPEVQFYRKQGKDRIKIISENNSIDVYSPLIMIDHISVFDHEALIALSPEKIERIDLINEIYVKGNVPFGGVLAIHSRKGDMAGIDLPKGSYFFDYQSFNPELQIKYPVLAEESRVPDTRNTVYWNGELLLEPGSRMEIPFQAPHTPGNYVVFLRGISANGELFSDSASFRVE